MVYWFSISMFICLFQDWKEEEARQEALLQTEFEKILEDSEQYLSGVTQLLKNEFQ